MNKDLLNRQGFVERVIKIIELQSKQKKTSCFAINGKWGVGKSFILEMLEEQLEKIQFEETSTDKYMIFHYNCWQYDYYEEPLVAIVASMLDTIDEKENLIPSDIKTKIKGFLKAVGSALLVKTNEAIEKKTGFNPQEVIDVITDAKESSAEKIEEEHKYDSNFIFKATLKKLQETIRDLSNDKTIVFVVDELDRCLPEYAIKVLERLHHVFDSIDNVQVVLSIDKSQLEHIIKKTFGEKTETQKYLSKFIDFEVNLDAGSFTDREEFDNKFAFYLQCFDYINDATKLYQVEDFKTEIFDGIDIRTRIEIIEKCNLLHRILNRDGKPCDFSIMCIEIFMVLTHNLGLDNFTSISNKTSMFRDDTELPWGIEKLDRKYQEEQDSGIPLWSIDNGKIHIRINDIFSLVFAISKIEKDTKSVVFVNGYTLYDATMIRKYIKDLHDLLYIIN